MKAIQSILLTALFAMTSLVAFAQGPSQERVTERPPSNSALSKLYSNVTAKFNGYFNAQLKLDEGIKSLADGYTDNYNLILDMYEFMAVPDAKSVSPDMDIAITKAAVDIKLHERSLFVDDCYLLIGQAQYVKRDFEAAEKTFSYVITTFDPKNPNNPMNKPVNAKDAKKQREKNAKQKKKERERQKANKKKEREEIAAAKKKAREARKKGDKEATYEDFLPKNDKKKKKDPDDKNYALKHRPVRKDAMVWMARTQIERGKYDEAQIWLNRLKDDEKLFKSLKPEVAAISAYYYLKQKKYEEAIAPLNEAIELSKNRRDKARMAYIVAQIHQKAGRQQEAADAFERVIKYRPSYEMEFSARLNMIKNTLSDDPIAVAEAEKQLKKLLKDEKNEEYKDQIYFVLGEIAFKANEDDKAIGYLKKSVYFNFGNDATKAEAYLKLADTFYEKENYVDAKYYYDSTLTKIAKTDERADLVEQRSKSLTDIAQNIQIITKQDSFLRIKNLIDESKEKEFLAIAQKIKEAEEKAKLKNKKAERPTGRRVAGRATSLQADDALPGSSKSKVPKFWAYENNLEKGKREFQKIWGNGRKLSDNWRRSKRLDANSDVDFEEGKTEEIFDLTKEEAIALFTRIGVPMDEAAAQKADNNIMEAMASLGTLYRERLDNVNKSVDALEKLIKRYPDTKYRLESLYALYIQHKQLNNNPEAEEYRKLILKEGRNTKFAKAIEDPNFLAGEKEKEVRLQDYYNSAYADFKKGAFKASRDKLDGVTTTFGEDYSMKSKFALLGAMCTGAIDGEDAYKLSLKEVTSKYSGTEEATKAQEILDILGGKKITIQSKPGDKTDNKPTVDASGFTIHDNSQHFVMVVYDSKKIKQTDAAAFASDYNKKYHRLKRLRVSNFLITIEIPTVLIRRFKNKEEALAYVLEIQKANEDFLGVKDPSFKAIAVNQENYKLILRDRGKWDAYIAFFDKVYLEE